MQSKPSSSSQLPTIHNSSYYCILRGMFCAHKPRSSFSQCLVFACGLDRMSLACWLVFAVWVLGHLRVLQFSPKVTPLYVTTQFASHCANTIWASSVPWEREASQSFMMAHTLVQWALAELVYFRIASQKSDWCHELSSFKDILCVLKVSYQTPMIFISPRNIS